MQESRFTTIRVSRQGAKGLKWLAQPGTTYAEVLDIILAIMQPSVNQGGQLSQDSLEGLRALMVELDRNRDSQLADVKKALAEIRKLKPKGAFLAETQQTLQPCIILPFVSPHLLNPGFRVHAHYLSTTHAQIMPTNYQIPTVASSFRFR